MFMYIIKILNVLWLEARAKRVFCRIQILYIKVKYLEIFKELWASCSILMIGFKCSMFDIFAFSILKLQNENGVVTLTFTFANNWKWSFMTVEFAIPYLPQSKKIWCLHCDLRVPLQKTYPLIRCSFAGVAIYIFFSIFNYLSYKSLTVFNDFFSLCILLLVNHYKDFFFQFANFLCPMFMCTCISLFCLNVLYMAVEISGVRIHSKCV